MIGTALIAIGSGMFGAIVMAIMSMSGRASSEAELDKIFATNASLRTENENLASSLSHARQLLDASETECDRRGREVERLASLQYDTAKLVTALQAAVQKHDPATGRFMRRVGA